MTPAQAVELRHETRWPTEPTLVFLNHLGTRASLPITNGLPHMLGLPMTADCSEPTQTKNAFAPGVLPLLRG